MINPKLLRNFLAKANKAGYASGKEANWTKHPDGSTTIHFEDGPWSMDDHFYGGEPFGGNEVISYNGKPVWMMVYYGGVDPNVDNISKVYTFLKQSLAKMPEETPFRGPKEHKDGDLIYRNSWEGTLENFYGKEVIINTGKEIYQTRYSGGLIDLRPE